MTTQKLKAALLVHGTFVKLCLLLEENRPNNNTSGIWSTGSI
uniref:Uncharacterized protein n=1 Tax=Setaria italica TaxID=4555 RepID=K4A3W7_SETIT